MSEHERARRPTLPRTAPIRNWSSVVSMGGAEGQLEDAVGNANRVLEEYLRAGEASARLFQRTTGLGAAVGDSQDIAQRMTRAAADLLTFWTELFARTTGGTPPPASTNGSASPNGAAAAAVANQPSTADTTAFAVEVHSARPVTVTVDVKPEARSANLCIDRLHSRATKGATIRNIQIDRATDSQVITFRVRLPEDQAPGVYTGVIVNEETSLPAGTMAVQVHPVKDAARAQRPNERRRRSR